MVKIDFHSHEQQDEFVFNVFNGKRDGFFLDISCGNPRIGSNTYTLEKFCGWTGFGFDILDIEERDGWSQYRTSQFVQGDATSEGMTEFLQEHLPKDQVVDYVSLDVDAGGTSLALEVLKRVLAAGVKFKVMTFEHEFYQHGPALRDEQRKLLEAQGMVMLFENVKGWTIGQGRHNDTEFYEDWWINPEYFEPELLQVKDKELYTFQCVEKLRNYRNNWDQYQANHVCSRSFPDQYCLHWPGPEEAQWPTLRASIEQLFIQKNIPKPR